MLNEHVKRKKKQQKTNEKKKTKTKQKKRYSQVHQLFPIET